ncbi:MAG: hypothetical protein AAGB19_04325 [Cyanobacteria bacterium P01_F01_bin.3]
MYRNLALLILASLACCQARAEATYDLSLQADGESRWFELFSASFVQITPGKNDVHEDGFFSVADESFTPTPFDAETFDADSFEATEFVQLGGGVNAFPNEGNFQGDYSVIYDDSNITGAGLESAPLVGASLGFETDYGVTDVVGQFDNYTTEVLNTSGHIQFLDGEVAGIHGEVELTFTYPQFGGFYSIPGTLKFCGGAWELFADGPLETMSGNSTFFFRTIWDGHGLLEDLAATGLTADYDNSGVVDGSDFLSWQRKFDGLSGSLPNDIDGGSISSAQLASWETQYAQETSAIMQVPEPATTVILVRVMLIVASGFRRHNHNPIEC